MNLENIRIPHSVKCDAAKYLPLDKVQNIGYAYAWQQHASQYVYGTEMENTIAGCVKSMEQNRTTIKSKSHTSMIFNVVRSTQVDSILACWTGFVVIVQRSLLPTTMITTSEVPAQGLESKAEQLWSNNKVRKTNEWKIEAKRRQMIIALYKDNAGSTVWWLVMMLTTTMMMMMRQAKVYGFDCDKFQLQLFSLSIACHFIFDTANVCWNVMG